MYCGMPKGTSRTEVTLNSEKIKPVALAVIELHLSEGISQSVEILLNICSNLSKTFQVDLKACLGLAMLPHYHLRKLRLVFG